MEVAVAGVTPSFLTQLTLERGDYPLGAEFPRCVGPEWRKYVEVSTFIQGDRHYPSHPLFKYGLRIGRDRGS